MSVMSMFPKTPPSGKLNLVHFGMCRFFSGRGNGGFSCLPVSALFQRKICRKMPCHGEEMAIFAVEKPQ